jgi:hypothetical protein
MANYSVAVAQVTAAIRPVVADKEPGVTEAILYSPRAGLFMELKIREIEPFRTFWR